MPSAPVGLLTIDGLAAASGLTTRRLRSYQTMGLLPPPQMRGRTGLYGPAHVERVAAIVRLQDEGFSLESLGILFEALAAGRSLGDVLGPTRSGDESPSATTDPPAARPHDEADLYGFAQLDTGSARRRAGRPLLTLVPTTLWDESAAS